MSQSTGYYEYPVGALVALTSVRISGRRWKMLNVETCDCQKALQEIEELMEAWNSGCMMGQEVLGKIALVVLTLPEKEV